MVPLPCGSDGPGPHLDREGLPGALSLLSGGPSSLRAATVTHPCGSRGVSAGRTPSGERGAEPTHPGFPPGKSAPGEPLCPPLPAPCPARGTALPEPSPAVPLFVHMEHVFLLNLKPSLSIVPQRELSHVVPVSGGKGPRPLARSSLPDTQLRNLRSLEAAGPQGAPTPWSLLGCRWERVPIRAQRPRPRWLLAALHSQDPPTTAGAYQTLTTCSAQACLNSHNSHGSRKREMPDFSHFTDR